MPLWLLEIFPAEGSSSITIQIENLEKEQSANTCPKDLANCCTELSHYTNNIATNYRTETNCCTELLYTDYMATSLRTSAALHQQYRDQPSHLPLHLLTTSHCTEANRCRCTEANPTRSRPTFAPTCTCAAPVQQIFQEFIKIFPFPLRLILPPVV